MSMKYFMIATRGRTGSTALASMLDQIEGVRCFAELIGDRCSYCTEIARWKGLRTIPDSPSWSREYTELGRCLSYAHCRSSMSLEEWWRSVESVLSGRARSVGFKVVAHTVDLQPELLDLARKRLDTIFLTRDPATQAISGLYANRIGYYNVSLNDEPDDVSRFLEVRKEAIQLDPVEVAREATYAQLWQSTFREFLGNIEGSFLEVKYEELFGNQTPNPSLDRLAQYFQIPEFPRTEPRYFRNIENVSESITNLDEIRSHLRSRDIDISQLAVR